MFLSVFDIFKIGIGPSSSHSMGPMTAASLFLKAIRAAGLRPARLRAVLRGSLAFTGKGHATDRATALGLMGFLPATLDAEEAEAAEAAARATHRITPPGLEEVAFDPDKDVVFDFGPPLPGHANGIIFQALDAAGGLMLEKIYYSIGGGFVVSAEEMAQDAPQGHGAGPSCPYPFSSADQMLKMGQASGLSIAAMKRANEEAIRPRAEVDAGLDRIWDVMNSCLSRGLSKEGVLPGGLKTKRRAKAIFEALERESASNLGAPHLPAERLSAYAMAVNEENAAGGRVVTAPTNGAAGVIPAVIRFWLETTPGAGRAGIHDFLLTAAAIGGLIKHNASISGAEVGCQGEVGSASAMAAAGLCAVRGGSNAQIENAAEIALEHHLGMTCDPIKGLVQAPCIERNGFGAVKAMTAAALALRGDGEHLVPLDSCIETMRATGRDMSDKYKETSLGGLAVAVRYVEC